MILAVLGVVIAPLGATLAGPAMAAQPASEMADDMPCCPDDAPMPMDCTTDCPFLALCVAGFTSVVIPPMQMSAAFGPLVGVAFAPEDSFALSSLAGDPPARPPKF